jgi:hypothetical protein
VHVRHRLYAPPQGIRVRGRKWALRGNASTPANRHPADHCDPSAEVGPIVPMR